MFLLKNSKALVVQKRILFIEFVYFTVIYFCYQNHLLSRFQTRCIRNACFQLANFKPILTEYFAGKCFCFKSNFHAGVVVSISIDFFHPHETFVVSLIGEWVLCLD